ncbi:isochorismate synthase [Aliikangiella coralliicola]|uniref:isochorismate synthase n=1 Tax=Aliikangiella coralliicola TaxID=2592383 RepID=A0A545UCB2_9GAMM|nr:isochorismate synthase [Aliikangiella coralliicola]TQV87111.1 isochorismate synthase [Aliikangiella coralliicola]
MLSYDGESLDSSENSNILEEFREGESFFFRSEEFAFLTSGTLVKVPDTNLTCQSFEQTVMRTFEQAKHLMSNKTASIEPPLVVGAIPFDRTKPVNLRIPKSVKRFDPQTRLSVDAVEATHSLSSVKEVVSNWTTTHMRSVPNGDAYKQSVSQALDLFAKTELDKVVLARTLEIGCDQELPVSKLIARLAQSNPNGFIFAADSSLNQLSPRTLFGASPELLISKKGAKVFSNPLAGSAARSTSVTEDCNRAEALLRSTKDLHEHALVIESIVDTLSPYCKKLHLPGKPSLLKTPTMWHLSTLIQGELKDSETSSLSLAKALHPTPAVCGNPTVMARETISRLEHIERGFFTGTVGWSDINGDGEWSVTIRCAEKQAQLLKLYAGAGIVEGSLPDLELAETAAKFGTMLNALGISYSDAINYSDMGMSTSTKTKVA